MPEIPPPETSRAEHLKQKIHDIGLGELRPEEVVSRRDHLRKQTQIGLQREGPPTNLDGGLWAIRTGIPPITPEAWDKVPDGTIAFAANIAGTNWDVKIATKEKDGSIKLEDSSLKEYRGDQREVTYEDFIARMAYPIASEVLNNAIETGKRIVPIDVGVSLGFPHVNEKSREGMEAKLVGVPEEGENKGRTTKGWLIKDWDPKVHGNITKDLRIKLKELGIEVRSLVAINDTPAVALDKDAVKSATTQGLEVIPGGFVGGTGTNGAIDKKGVGLVNLEIGLAVFPEDEIFRQLKKNGWTKYVKPVLELETGESLAWRLAAGMQLLQNRDQTFKIDNQLFEDLKPNDPNNRDALPKDPALLDHIAIGTRATNPEIQLLAKQVLKRAGQVYGITLATIAEATGNSPQTESQDPKAFLVEGGTLLKGLGVKETAEQTAASLEQPIKIFEAGGLRGIASLAMAYEHLEI